MKNLGIIICVVATLAMASNANAVQSETLSRVLEVGKKADAPDGISEVRVNALRELGRSLGLRAGMIDESKKIVTEIELAKYQFDQNFNFGSLMFSSGALPPVIEEAQDVISLTDYSFRTAGKIYRIVAPVNFNGANWRNYLYLGLMTTDDNLVDESKRSLYPRNGAEEEFWKKVVNDAYAQGKKDARRIFEINAHRLERDFFGMRLFFDLFERGLVTAPTIATATEAISRPNPNTLIIGETIFRVTAQPTFNADDKTWKVKK